MKLGNPRTAVVAAANGRRVQVAEANAFATSCRSSRPSGHRATDLRGIAEALNARGVRIAHGGRWHVSNVKNVIDRVSR